MATGTMESLWSKANQTQLAPVENGTTASRAYAVGEYFCKDGLLYRVTTAISSGGTITPGTNCSQVTEGGINGRKSVSLNSFADNTVFYYQCTKYNMVRVFVMQQGQTYSAIYLVLPWSGINGRVVKSVDTGVSTNCVLSLDTATDLLTITAANGIRILIEDY